MTKLARLILAHPRRVVALWALLALGGGYLGLHLSDRLQNGGYGVPGSQSVRALQVGHKMFGDRAAAQSYIAILGPVRSASVLSRDLQLVRRSARTVKGVTGLGAPLSSPGGDAVLIPVTLAGSIGAAQTYIPALQRAVGRLRLRPARAVAVGQAAVYQRYLADGKQNLLQSALISFPVTLVILLIAFLSVTAAVLPLILAGACLGVTFGGLYLLTYGVQMSVFVEDTILILGLGLSIDFSLFMVTRLRECLARSPGGIEEALVETLSSTGRAIAISGATVAVSLAGLFLVGVGFFASMAVGAIGATLLAMAGALTLTPAVLVMISGRLERLPIRVAATAAASGAFWERLAGFVVRRRVAVVSVTIPVLLILSLPLTGLHISFKTFSILPSNDPVRVASEQVGDAFGQGFGSPAVVLGRTSPRELDRVLGAQGGIVAVGAPQRGSGGWVRIDAVLEAAPDSSTAEDVVASLRGRLRRSLGPKALVGGPTAEALDFVNRIDGRVPRVVLAVLLLEICFLTAVFQAPVIALKAALTTLLSVGATLGITTAIFGANGVIAYFVPLLLFATVFGLSTDYEVFLLSRVREQYRRGDSNLESLRVAMVRSSRSITLAGITMSVVFFAFASSSLAPFRQLGVGMGIAILLDVTIVRGLLVPASVALLGDLNWWRPSLRGARAKAHGHLSEQSLP
jgi:uncharacterized membrane protein YdfJ with MMPL/SSD domain